MEVSNKQKILNLFQESSEDYELEGIENKRISREQFQKCVNYLKNTKKYNKKWYFQESTVYNIKSGDLRIIQWGRKKGNYPMSDVQKSVVASPSCALQSYILQEKIRVSSTIHDTTHNIRFTLKKEVEKGQKEEFPQEYRQKIERIRERKRDTFVINKNIKVDLTEVKDGNKEKYEVEYEVINWIYEKSRGSEQKIYEKIVEIHKKVISIIEDDKIYVNEKEKIEVLQDYYRVYRENVQERPSKFIRQKEHRLEKENITRMYKIVNEKENKSQKEEEVKEKYKLLINTIGEVYLVDMQKNIRKTGIVVETQKNSIIEWPPGKMDKRIVDIHRNLVRIIREDRCKVSEKEEVEVQDQYQRIERKTEQQEYEKFLGPKAITLGKENVIKFYNTPSVLENYTVTEKADGIRCSVFINKRGLVYLIDMQRKVRKTGIVVEEEKNSIIDSELIYRPRKSIIAIFDVYFNKNKLVGDLPLQDEKKESRLKILERIQEEFERVEQKQKQRYRVIKKSFAIINKNNIGVEIKKIYSKKYIYKIDGLIFTPCNLAVGGNIYNKESCKLDGRWDYQFKWKQEKENTADFYVSCMRETRDSISQVSQDLEQKQGLEHNSVLTVPSSFGGTTDDAFWDEKVSQSLQLWPCFEQKGARQPGGAVLETPKGVSIRSCGKPYKLQLYVKGWESVFEGYSIKDQLQMQQEKKRNEYVKKSYKEIECEKEIDEGVWEFYTEQREWKPLKKREDKTELYNNAKQRGQVDGINDIQVVKQIEQTSEYKVTYKELIQYEEKIKEEEIKDILINNQKLYYSRNIQRDQLKIKEMIDYHYKSVKFNLYRNGMQYSRVKNNFVKKSIAELAVGKGGDVHNINKIGYKKIVGFDIVEDNIINMQDGVISRNIDINIKNIKEGKKEIVYLYLIADIGENIYNEESYKECESREIFRKIYNNKKISESEAVNKKYKGFIKKNVFGTVSCQFAIHYMFKNEEKLDKFIENVDNLIAPGGTFIGTTIDKDNIVKLFNERNHNKVESNREDVLLWRIEGQYERIEKGNMEPKNIYGNKICMYIESINQPNIEYLIDFKVLQQKLQKKKIMLKQKAGFEYYKKFNNLSIEEQIYSKLNIYFIFQKSLN